jgi:hypothetical protein
MLEVLFESMVSSLRGSNAKPDTLEKYQVRWNDALDGHSKGFPCPVCFAAGDQEAALKALPPKGSVHNVKCTACNRQYSYVDDDDF